MLARLSALLPPTGNGQTLPWLSVVVPVAVAVLGLLGVAVAAWMAARTAVRVRLIDLARAEAEPLRSFQLRTVAAMNELTIAMAQANRGPSEALAAAKAEALERARKAELPPGEITIEFAFQHDAAAVERVRLATNEWRQVLAEAHIYADERLFTALSAFDAQREIAIVALNLGDVEAASREVDTLRDYQSGQIYRLLQVNKLMGPMSIARVLQIRSFRQYTRSWRTHLESEVAKVERRYEEVAREHRDGSVSSV